MAKTDWNELLTRCRTPHLLVAVLPGSSERERLFNAQSAVRLLVRLIRKLPTKDEFAVTVSRQSEQREIVCAFRDGADAAMVANVANASKSGSARYFFVLDETAEEALINVAGQPQINRHSRTTPYERWNARQPSD